MEKYVKLQDVNDLLIRMFREPRYQHEDEDYYSGVAQVASELVGVPTIVLEEPLYAQWKTREAKNDYLWVECSNCGFRVENYNAVELGSSSTDIIGYKWHACPKCASKMIYKKETSDDLS